MPELSREEKIKIFEKLPKELRDLMGSEDTGAFLLYLGARYNLDNEKISALSKIVGDVVLGLTSLTDLSKEIHAKITPDMEVALHIAQELNTELFFPVIKFFSPKGAAPTGAVPSPAAAKPMPVPPPVSAPKIVMPAPPRPVMPAVPSTPIVPPQPAPLTSPVPPVPMRPVTPPQPAQLIQVPAPQFVAPRPAAPPAPIPAPRPPHPLEKGGEPMPPTPPKIIDLRQKDQYREPVADQKTIKLSELPPVPPREPIRVPAPASPQPQPHPVTKPTPAAPPPFTPTPAPAPSSADRYREPVEIPSGPVPQELNPEHIESKQFIQNPEIGRSSHQLKPDVVDLRSQGKF